MFSHEILLGLCQVQIQHSQKTCKMEEIIWTDVLKNPKYYPNPDYLTSMYL